MKTRQRLHSCALDDGRISAGRRCRALPLLICLLCLLWACGQDLSTSPSMPSTTGITDSEILIGSSLALEGHAGYLGTQTLHGALAYIHHVNENGGVHGRRIRVIAYDDGYDPPRCVLNTQRLIIQDQVFALFCYVGTPTAVKIKPLVEEARIPLVGMFTGAQDLREPLSRYLINVRASYYQETGAAVRYLVEKRKVSRIAIFYQYDAYGFDGLRGTELALKSYGLLPVATGSYVRGTLGVEEGLARILAADAEAVVMIGTYEPCARFIQLARSTGFRPIFSHVSFVGADELTRRLGPDAEGVIVTQVVPPPEAGDSASRLWGTDEYIRRLAAYFPEDQPNFVSLEGYVNAKVLIEGLRRAGPDLDRERFIDAIESIRDFDLGIVNSLSFSPFDHQGLEQVYFTLFENGRFVWLPD
ncbi:MAG: ABC transporter substrate-binding protein [Desulfobacterales bacterium]